MTAFRTGRLEVQVEIAPGPQARVVLAGRLDDTCQLAELAARLPAGEIVGEIVIDTAGVTFVNSIGMREWVRLLRQLRERGSVRLDRLADVLLVHMNVLSEFRGATRISSFHASYVCGACGFEGSMLVDADANAEALRQLRAPRLTCPECGAPAMELADFPERYLSIFA